MARTQGSNAQCCGCHGETTGGFDSYAFNAHPVTQQRNKDDSQYHWCSRCNELLAGYAEAGRLLAEALNTLRETWEAKCRERREEWAVNVKTPINLMQRAEEFLAKFTEPETLKQEHTMGHCDICGRYLPANQLRIADKHPVTEEVTSDMCLCVQCGVIGERFRQEKEEMIQKLKKQWAETCVNSSLQEKRRKEQKVRICYED
jgi:hypothetical protein